MDLSVSFVCAVLLFAYFFVFYWPTAEGDQHLCQLPTHVTKQVLQHVNEAV